MRKAFRSGPHRVLQLGALFVVAFAGSAIASQLSGAIFTTTSDGTTVNANIYDNKEDVYLNGGPQNQNGSLLPEGDYYFQVTNPPGSGPTEILLSSDNADCRQVHVGANGRIEAAIGSCPHATGTLNTANGSLPVQLFPFDDTPNPGGEYKVYLITKSAATIDADDPRVLHFTSDNAKTDNFKVKRHKAPCPEGNPQCHETEPASISVCKFWDKDGDGSHGGDEPLLSNWTIKADGSNSGSTTQTTSALDDASFGCTTFTFDSDSLPQTVKLSEVLQTGWKQSAPNGDSAPFTVSNYESTVTLDHGDDLIAPDFGNHCDGCAPPTTGKTAAGGYKKTFTWTIGKSADKTIVKQVGGNATFNYTVTVTHDAGTVSDVKVTGTITVSNPNSFAVAINGITDQLSNGTVCVVTGGGAQTLAAGSSNFGYECSLSGVPQSVDNTVTVSWSDDAAHGLVGGSADFKASGITFAENQIDEAVNVTDSYAGSLGTASVAGANPKTFTYARTVPVPQYGCQSYDNTATYTKNDSGGTASDSKTVTACGPVKTGALTIGFWQNKNGQSIITGGASISGVCKSGTWLRQYAPFQDLSATASCSVVGTYVTNVIKAANASGASMNAMLKAQMLATALDVYFSDPALGTNKIGAPAAIGGVSIDVTKICKMIDSSSGVASCSGTYLNASTAFGGATSLTVSQILTYAASQSNVGGSLWYANVKATQELAKNTFDAINNQVAFAP
jgi:hypothetical protein